MTDDATDSDTNDGAAMSVDGDVEQADDGIDALRSTVVSAVAGVRVVTQIFPLAATLDDIAHARAEHNWWRNRHAGR